MLLGDPETDIGGTGHQRGLGKVEDELRQVLDPSRGEPAAAVGSLSRVLGRAPQGLQGADGLGFRRIDDVLAGNLCRCTGYGPIIAAAGRMKEIAESDRFDAAERVLDEAREERAQARRDRYAARQAYERASATADRLARRVREVSERLDRAAELAVTFQLSPGGSADGD